MNIQELNVNVDLVKPEIILSVCNVCLSKNRALSTVNDKADLFMCLLGHQTSIIDPDNAYICWECMAVLQKMRTFQWQVQQAQFVLQQMLYKKDVSPKTLSKLSKIKLENIDITSFSTENKTISEVYNDFPEIKITRIPVTNDVPVTNCIPVTVTNNSPSLIDNKDIVIKLVKEEDDDFCNEDNFPDQENSEQSEQDIVINIKSEKQTKTKKERKTENYIKFCKKAKKTRNPNFDLNNYESYFYDTPLSDSEIENLGKNVNNKKKVALRLCCKECNKVFDTALELKRHKTYVHILKAETPGPFKCLVCKTMCPDLESLRVHWAQHNVILRCKICHQTILWRSCMRVHAEMHAYLWTCVLCKDLPAVFQSSRDFGYHTRSLHRVLTCDHCGQGSTSKKAMANHIRSKHSPPVCIPCNKEFKNSASLRRHNYQFHPEVLDKVVKPELTYCVECNKHFPSEARYKVHLNNSVVHKPDIYKKPLVPCPECDKMFARKMYMKNHYKLFHQKQTKHYCALCDKYLVTAWAMKQHVQGVHQKIRMPKTKVCDTCGRAFGTNAVLEKHIRTHTGERPYKCTHCSAAFAQSSALASHTRTQHKH